MRQPYTLVPRWIRLDAVLLENGGQVLDRLSDRLALPARASELDDQRVDIVDREFVEAAIAQDGTRRPSATRCSTRVASATSTRAARQRSLYSLKDAPCPDRCRSWIAPQLERPPRRVVLDPGLLAFTPKAPSDASGDEHRKGAPRLVRYRGSRWAPPARV
jgi:hypothetical protein